MSEQRTFGYHSRTVDPSSQKRVIKWAPFVKYVGSQEYVHYTVPATTNAYGINRGEMLVLNSLADMMHFIDKMKKNQGWEVVFAQKNWKESNYEGLKHNLAELNRIAKEHGIKRFDAKEMSDKELEAAPAPVVEVEESEEEEDEPEEAASAPKKRKRKKTTGGS